jgi:hypothetical protein
MNETEYFFKKLVDQLVILVFYPIHNHFKLVTTFVLPISLLLGQKMKRPRKQRRMRNTIKEIDACALNDYHARQVNSNRPGH